ncbi:hypothetical protein MBLNU459_g0183t1 [Dothideomycetes sp. NU459]
MLLSNTILSPSSTIYAYKWEIVGFRAAWVSVTQLPLVYLLSCKINPVSILSGISYERLNWIHRWTARTLFLTVTVHWAFFYREWDLAQLVSLELEMMTMVKYGFGAWGVLGWLVLSGFGFFRHAHYEIFVLQHIAAAILLLWLVYLHVPNYATYNVWLSVGFLALDWTARMTLAVWRNVRTSSIFGFQAEVNALGDSYMLLTIKDVSFAWEAGQHLEFMLKVTRQQAFAILNPDGQVLHLSPSWYEFTGLDKAESNGTEWVQAVHPDDSASMLEAWQEVLQYKYDHWTFEARYRMHNGEYRWFLVRAQPYKDEAGVILRWFASMLDVNESMLQRLQTERIRQSILKLMSKADVSLWGVNQNHEIHIREGALSWIPSSQQQVGPGAPRDVSGHTAEREEQEIANMIQSILDGQQSQATLEHQMEGRWYRTKFVADLDNTINDKDGKAVVQAALGLTIDITDVRARAMLQIENQGLIANERAAQDATKLKSRFLANMSHEIRTPISGIIGLSELLSESVLNREQEELVGGIQQSAAFLLSLINDILDFSKIESGHMDIEAVAFQPCKVINDLLRMIGIQAKEKGLQLIYRNDLSEEPSVVGDPGRLRQVLTNLLSNSIKFTQEGSVSLSLRAITPRIDFAEDGKDSELDKRPQRPAADDDAGENLTLEFVVEDTGCGISEEVMQKLFRPFSQADSSTARTHGGTGLGLTISRQLVEMMGGRIDLTSRPSFGTVATFQIPYLRSTPGHPTTPRSTSTTQPSTRDSSVSTATTGLDHTIAPSSLAHRPEKIDVQTLTLEERNRTHVLVVEDNAVNQRIAKANLRKLGFSVAAVWNGEEALAYLDRSPSPDNSVPDIIFMDCMMPVLDGYKATQILRHDKARFSKAIRAIPVIAMTASAIQGDREKCKAAGMDDYLTKPTSKDTMERAIQLWVFRHRNSPDGQ